MPRPSKYSPEVADRILQALRAGNTLVASALYVGISYETLRVWRERFPAFSVALDRAEAEAEVMYAAVVAKCAREGDWRAAMTWLERRRHDDWRERKELQHTGKDGESLGDSLTEDDRATRILAIVQRARERAADAADSAATDLDTSDRPTD